LLVLTRLLWSMQRYRRIRLWYRRSMSFSRWTSSTRRRGSSSGLRSPLSMLIGRGASLRGPSRPLTSGPTQRRDHGLLSAVPTMAPSAMGRRGRTWRLRTPTSRGTNSRRATGTGGGPVWVRHRGAQWLMVARLMVARLMVARHMVAQGLVVARLMVARH
jgi:hypothetical protein